MQAWGQLRKLRKPGVTWGPSYLVDVQRGDLQPEGVAEPLHGERVVDAHGVVRAAVSVLVGVLVFVRPACDELPLPLDPRLHLRHVRLESASASTASASSSSAAARGRGGGGVLSLGRHLLPHGRCGGC